MPESTAHVAKLIHTSGRDEIGDMSPLFGQLIEQTEISYFRPAHFHAIVAAKGYQPVITHLFRQGAPYLENDVVFGVREPLITPFKRHEPGPAPGGKVMTEPYATVEYDFILAPAA